MSATSILAVKSRRLKSLSQNDHGTLSGFGKQGGANGFGIGSKATFWHVAVGLMAILLLLPSHAVQAQPVSPPALKADVAIRPAVEESLHVQSLRDTRDPSLVELMIQVDKPPVGMAFDVSLRLDDRTLFVGPVAWAADKIKWWAFNIDVPPSKGTIQLVFTPSAAAASKLKRNQTTGLAGLDSIWSGEAIVKAVNVRQQRLSGMSGREPPTAEQAREEQTEQLEGDDPTVRQFKQGGDLALARQRLEAVVGKEPANATAWFNLGCLNAAGADWRRAMECFAKVRQIGPPSALTDKAQQQLRRIGSYFVYAVRNQEDVQAMCGLGILYQRGWGPAPDRLAAKRWYRNAANAGHPEAMYHLACMYEQDLAAVPNNPKAGAWYRKESLEMYRKAAALGNEEAKRWVATHDSQ